MSNNINETECEYETFDEYCKNYKILENKIENILPKLEFSNLIYKRYGIDIKNLDNIYRKLLISDVIENLYSEKILNLVK